MLPLQALLAPEGPGSFMLACGGTGASDAGAFDNLGCYCEAGCSSNHGSCQQVTQPNAVGAARNFERASVKPAAACEHSRRQQLI